jgi:CRISPR system Cascade subunit CasC
MKLIELHILQSFPVTCLNRDDVGAPKTAYFGGCQRARVSSQCWKRAIRLMARDLARGKEFMAFEGIRTRKAIGDLAKSLENKGVASVEAPKIAADICEGFLKKQKEEEEEKKEGKTKQAKTDVATPTETSTLLYFSSAELDAMADAVARALREKTKKALLDVASTAAPAAHLKDAADIAIFGRMVANESSLTLEGAGLFSHALSTHRSDTEIDFFTAVDDRHQKGEDMGAGMMGSLDFNSACYYRYVGLNLDMLKDKEHLDSLSGQERAKVLDAFLRAAIMAVPPARKNSMFGFNPPALVLGFRRTGQPLSLVNAFEKPVRSNSGYVEESVRVMQEHWSKLNGLYKLFDPTRDVEVQLPPDNLDACIERLIGKPDEC